jgi:hypothetical protein
MLCEHCRRAKEERFGAHTHELCDRFTFKQVDPLIVDINTIISTFIVLKYELKWCLYVLVPPMIATHQCFTKLWVLFFKIVCQ